VTGTASIGTASTTPCAKPVGKVVVDILLAVKERKA
jgi:hypothetical protein